MGLAWVMTGCAGFDREWKRARQEAPAGRPGPEGAWAGTWSSPGTDHEGALRCVVRREQAPPAVDTEAAFIYHASWSIFSGTFPTKQPLQRQPDGSYRSTGTWKLPAWAGGVYAYDIVIRGDRFTGTWKSKRDAGSFDMTRVADANR
jgi:hypothetical protein